jgi:hypothetical protein
MLMIFDLVATPSGLSIWGCPPGIWDEMAYFQQLTAKLRHKYL